eukprot:TRINITY_DN13050_c0_g1_i2.p1 TRINITY_DN13050_c0_g1~~TRINITY_DN13050_c0_g1_i2.p1  ORF type:complete len:206 (+),score=34.03 TRINITY_DN13050_c0_g1_i2:41-658(+)
MSSHSVVGSFKCSIFAAALLVTAAAANLQAKFYETPVLFTREGESAPKGLFADIWRNISNGTGVATDQAERLESLDTVAPVILAVPIVNNPRSRFEVPLGDVLEDRLGMTRTKALVTESVFAISSLVKSRYITKYSLELFLHFLLLSIPWILLIAFFCLLCRRKNLHLADIVNEMNKTVADILACLLYTSPSPRDRQKSRMPSSA